MTQATQPLLQTHSEETHTEESFKKILKECNAEYNKFQKIRSSLINKLQESAGSLYASKALTAKKIKVITHEVAPELISLVQEAINIRILSDGAQY